MKNFLEFIKSAILFAVILWALFFFVVGIKMVPNEDMFPRLDAGDIMLYYKIAKQPVTREVIVLKKNGTEYVGRVIAKGGDSVEITEDGNLIINGNMVTEESIYSSTPRYEGFVQYPLTLASDEYFILSDKREGGEDSRYYGPVKQSEIKGTVIGQYRRSNF